MFCKEAITQRKQMEKNLKNHEVIEDLNLDGLKIIQSTKLYRFTSDPVILANFVKAKKTDRLLDIGTGSGIIPILVCHKTNLKSAVGVELQPEMADMATRSVELNALSDKITIQNVDIKDFKSVHVFDIVTCNPPYKKCGTCKPNEEKSKAIARHEITLNLTEVCACAKKHLKFGGRFYVCIDASRTAELLFELKSVGIEPKKMFYSQSSLCASPSILFVEAVNGGKEGIKVLPNVVVNDKDGNYLENVKKMRFE